VTHVLAPVVLRVHKAVRRISGEKASSRTASIAQRFPYRTHGPLTLSSEEAKSDHASELLQRGQVLDGDGNLTATGDDGDGEASDTAAEEGKPRNRRTAAGPRQNVRTQKPKTAAKPKSLPKVKAPRRTPEICNVCGDLLKGGVSQAHRDTLRCQKKGAALQRARIATGVVTVEVAAQIDARAAAVVARAEAAAQSLASTVQSIVTVSRPAASSTPRLCAAPVVHQPKPPAPQQTARSHNPTARKRTQRAVDDDEFE